MRTLTWLRIEGFVLFTTISIIYIVFFKLTWLVLIVFFAPDISMIAYIFGPVFGAFIYNLAHSYIFPVMILVMATVSKNHFDLAIEPFQICALIWMAHIGFDRALGYGLKEITGFCDTHLGKIGKIHKDHIIFLIFK